MMVADSQKYRVEVILYLVKHNYLIYRVRLGQGALVSLWLLSYNVLLFRE